MKNAKQAKSDRLKMMRPRVEVTLKKKKLENKEA